MSGRRIVGIVLGVVLVLGVLVFVGGYFWLKTQGPKLREKGEAAMAEGAEFGAATDNEGCLEESLVRFDLCGSGFTCHVMNNVFVQACLEESAPVAGFCDGVPASDSITGSVAWRLEQCEERGLGGNFCGNFFGQIQEFCDSR